MEAVHHGTGVGYTFQYELLFFVCLEAGRPFESNVDATDAAGVGFHDLQHGDLHAFQVQRKIPGFNSHCGRHTGRKGGSDQVGGGKSLTFALVVHGGISLYIGPGLQVCGNRS
jgi:hypothetical protein